ncbi:MAG: hypothetical protein H2057_08015 [Alphaproteobacteria bacterium]|nr:hypothetical protein [Alphaproteobacteria bacterium]
MKAVLLFMAILFALPLFASVDDQEAAYQKSKTFPSDLSKRLLEEEIVCFQDRVNYGLTCKEIYALFETHKQMQAASYLIPLAPHGTLASRLCAFLTSFLTPVKPRTMTVAQLQHFMATPYEDPVYPSSWVFRVGGAWFQLINDHGVTLNHQFKSSPQSLPETYLDKLNPGALITFEQTHDFEGYRTIHNNGTPYFEKFLPCLNHFQSHERPWAEETCVFRAPLMIHTFSPQQDLDLRLLHDANIKEHFTYLSHTFAAVTLHDFWVRPLEGYKPQG